MIVCTPRGFRFFTVSAFVACIASPARAEGEDAIPADLPRLILEDPRSPVDAPESDLVRLQIHGEYQLRYVRMQSLPMEPSASVRASHPGATYDSLGQNDYVWHWLRLTPRLQIKDTIEIVGQMDLLTGLVLGDLAHDTFADQTPRD